MVVCESRRYAREAARLPQGADTQLEAVKHIVDAIRGGGDTVVCVTNYTRCTPRPVARVAE